MSVADDSDRYSIPRLRIPPPFRLPSQRYFIIKSLGFTIENGEINDVTTSTLNELDIQYNIISEASDETISEDGDIIISEGETGTTYTIETVSETVDLSISRDGAASFGSSLRLDMNRIGKRKSRFIFQRLGHANDCTFQLRFNGFGRYVVLDGMIEIYQ